MYVKNRLMIPQALHSPSGSLREATNKTHPITTPTDCLDFLIHHTPAHLYVTSLKIEINKPMAAELRNRKLLSAIQHAQGLLGLELGTASSSARHYGFCVST